MHWVHWEHNIIGFTMMVLLHTKLRSPLMIPWRSTFLGCKEKGIEKQIKLVWSCNTLLHSSSVSCSLRISFSIFGFFFFWKRRKNAAYNLICNLLEVLFFNWFFFNKFFSTAMYTVSFSLTSVASSSYSIQKSSSSKLLF